jgi:adenylylsulfate kinase-like enzyme
MDVLVKRDVKGLYKKAPAGEISNFTGVSDPYKPPLTPEIVINTSTETADEGVGRILATLSSLRLIPL